MYTVKHISNFTSTNFIDHVFEITGAPMTNNNTIVMSDALNDKLSKYGDGDFSPKRDGSSYTISVRGMASQIIFKDAAALQDYILEKLNTCTSKLQQRKN